MFSDLITKYGTFAGLGLIAVFLGAYFFSPELMLSQKVYWASMIVTLGAMWVGTSEDKKMQLSGEVDDYPFKAALRVAFGIFALSSLIYHVFDLTMFMVVNPELADMQLEATLGSIEELTPYFGEDWADQTSEMLEKNPPAPSMSNSFFDYTFGLLGGFAMAALMALTMKR